MRARPTFKRPSRSSAPIGRRDRAAAGERRPGVACGACRGAPAVRCKRQLDQAASEQDEHEPRAGDGLPRAPAGEGRRRRFWPAQARVGWRRPEWARRSQARRARRPRRWRQPAPKAGGHANPVPGWRARPGTAPRARGSGIQPGEDEREPRRRSAPAIAAQPPGAVDGQLRPKRGRGGCWTAASACSNSTGPAASAAGSRNRSRSQLDCATGGPAEADAIRLRPPLAGRISRSPWEAAVHGAD